MPRKKKSSLPYTRVRKGVTYICLQYKVGDQWKSKWRRYNSKEEYARILTELREELAMHGAKAFDGDKMTFAELLTEYRRAHPNLKEHYGDPMAEFFGSRKIRSITYADCYQYREARRQVVKRYTETDLRSIATVNRELEALRAVLLYALRHGWIKFNPLAAGPPLILTGEEERRDRVPTPEEEAAILAVCVSPREHLRPLIIATRDTGLRRGALLSLRFSDIDWDRKLIRVPAPGNRYKKRPKAIGMTTRLLAEFRQLWEESNKDPNRKIFGWWHVKKGEDGEEIRTWRPVAGIKKAYATALKLAGVEDLRFTDWRHGYATDLMEAGVPQHLAMKLAGHTQAETHSIYANVDDRLALQAAARLDRLHAQRAGTEPDGPIANDSETWVN